MIARRSDLLLRLLDDLGSSNLVDQGMLPLVRASVSLADTCREVLEGHPRQPEVAVTVDVPADALALADQVRVTQIVDNLVSNALRYGGPDVRVSAVRESDVVRLSVTDDGPGVPDQLTDSLFEGYSRGEQSRGFGGCGLGLMIVRQLAEAMGGSVSYDRDCGSRFTVILPAPPSTRQPLAKPDPADRSHRGHSLVFWSDEESHNAPLVEMLTTYAAHGLTRGEAVVLAATPDHLERARAALSELGLDPTALTVSGQLVTLDADMLHHELAPDGRLDQAAFERLVGDPVRGLSKQWASLRVYGEVVDLYWRRGDNHLALELESCWDTLREEISFPLMCAYALAPGPTQDKLHHCHDSVVIAA